MLRFLCFVALLLVVSVRAEVTVTAGTYSDATNGTDVCVHPVDGTTRVYFVINAGIPGFRVVTHVGSTVTATNKFYDITVTQHVAGTDARKIACTANYLWIFGDTYNTVFDISGAALTNPVWVSRTTSSGGTLHSVEAVPLRDQVITWRNATDFIQDSWYVSPDTTAPTINDTLTVASGGTSRLVIASRVAYRPYLDEILRQEILVHGVSNTAFFLRDAMREYGADYPATNVPLSDSSAVAHTWSVSNNWTCTDFVGLDYVDTNKIFVVGDGCNSTTSSFTFHEEYVVDDYYLVATDTTLTGVTGSIVTQSGYTMFLSKGDTVYHVPIVSGVPNITAMTSFALGKGTIQRMVLEDEDQFLVAICADGIATLTLNDNMIFSPISLSLNGVVVPRENLPVSLYTSLGGTATFAASLEEVPSDNNLVLTLQLVKGESVWTSDTDTATLTRGVVIAANTAYSIPLDWSAANQSYYQEIYHSSYSMTSSQENFTQPAVYNITLKYKQPGTEIWRRFHWKEVTLTVGEFHGTTAADATVAVMDAEYALQYTGNKATEKPVFNAAGTHLWIASQSGATGQIEQQQRYITGTQRGGIYNATNRTTASIFDVTMLSDDTLGTNQRLIYTTGSNRFFMLSFNPLTNALETAGDGELAASGAEWSSGGYFENSKLKNVLLYHDGTSTVYCVHHTDWVGTEVTASISHNLITGVNANTFFAAYHGTNGLDIFYGAAATGCPNTTTFSLFTEAQLNEEDMATVKAIDGHPTANIVAVVSTTGVSSIVFSPDNTDSDRGAIVFEDHRDSFFGGCTGGAFSSTGARFALVCGPSYVVYAVDASTGEFFMLDDHYDNEANVTVVSGTRVAWAPDDLQFYAIDQTNGDLMVMGKDYGTLPPVLDAPVDDAVSVDSALNVTFTLREQAADGTLKLKFVPTACTDPVETCTTVTITIDENEKTTGTHYHTLNLHHLLSTDAYNTWVSDVSDDTIDGHDIPFIASGVYTISICMDDEAGGVNEVCDSATNITVSTNCSVTQWGANPADSCSSCLAGFVETDPTNCTSCEAAYFGTHCQLTQTACDRDYCNSGGGCEWPSTSTRVVRGKTLSELDFYCLCNATAFGLQCGLTAVQCGVTYCHGNGNCTWTGVTTNVGGTHLCSCDPLVATGATCNLCVKNTDPSYHWDASSGCTTCQAGYFGTNCELTAAQCDKTRCGDGVMAKGACTGRTTGCDCKDAWGGTDCSTDLCGPGGVANGDTCVCQPGHVFNKAYSPNMCRRECGAHAAADFSDTTYNCQCHVGYDEDCYRGVRCNARGSDCGAPPAHWWKVFLTTFIPVQVGMLVLALTYYKF